MNFADFITTTLSRLNPTPFVLGWIETRPWRLLIAGIPVLTAVAIVVAFRASMNEANGDMDLRHYLSSAAEALKQGDEKGADLRFRRAALIAPEDARPRFGLATLAEKQGDLEKATAIMELIAAERGDVAVQANKWLISKTPLDKLDIAGRKTLIRRLERAVEDDPENVDLRLTLAGTYAKAGFAENAIPHLRVAAASRPVYRITLIQLLMSSGQTEAALEEAASAERIFRERLAKEPGDLDSRLLCSSALVFQKKYRDAIQVLEQGAALSDPIVLRKATSAVTIAWARELRDENQDPRQILELTAAALRADPSNSAALMTLMDLARNAEAGGEAVAKLEELLAAGQSPWLIHMILGTRLLEIGENVKGAEHLEQAVKLNPSAAIAMNNLAWTLATQEPVDLKRAEELASQAVELAPANPQIRETRGQIYLKQGRWKEALTDLEAVLPAYSREAQLLKQLPHLHGSLAMAYERIGNADMARRHRELAPAKPPQPAAPNPMKTKQTGKGG